MANRKLSFLGASCLFWIASSACHVDSVIGSWKPDEPAPSTGGATSAGGQGGEGGQIPTLGDAFYLEAEDGELSGDFSVGAAEAASGGEFLVATTDTPGDEPGTGRARYSFRLEVAGDYVLWGRTRAPDPPHSRYFIRFDDDDFFPWRISTGEAWFWDDVHEDDDYFTPHVFSLGSGLHTLEIGSSQTEAQLDRLYLTSRGDVPPGNDTPCNPPHSIERAGACIPSCGSHGTTTCDEALCAGREALEAFDCTICCLAP